jgi:NAD(P)H-dependent flavin oxidoreductase YrpB (nitropropane dioxygenase family)
MIKSQVCDLLDLAYPIALGGMASIKSVELCAAVSEAGGLGALGASYLKPGEITTAVENIRTATGKPFALNLLLFMVDDEQLDATLAARPAVIAYAWPRPDQDLAGYFAKAHDVGAKVMFMTGDVHEAVRAKNAGADIIVAQGSEGGGHVGWMASLALLPMVVDAVAPLPVLAAGGIADGRGLAASLALGADGVLLGTRFLATEESPLHANFKQAILDSNGHDTVLTEIPDLAAGQVWPGAMARTQRNKFYERWAGHEWDVRACASEIRATIAKARTSGDAAEAPLLFGQDAGLINDVPSAGEIVTRIMNEATEIVTKTMPGLLSV